MAKSKATTDADVSGNPGKGTPSDRQPPEATDQEPVASGDAENIEDGPAPVDEVTALRNEVDHWKDLALRSRADLDNYRKRMSAEKTESIRYANQSLFEALLPVLDNFHFGLEAARNASDAQGVLMGMEMVLKQFEDFLENHRITVVPAEPGTAFDPNIHEAVAQDHHAEIPDGAILKVIRNGYQMGERLVRAANVVVSKGPATTDS